MLTSTTMLLLFLHSISCSIPTDLLKSTYNTHRHAHIGLERAKHDERCLVSPISRSRSMAILLNNQEYAGACFFFIYASEQENDTSGLVNF